MNYYTECPQYVASQYLVLTGHPVYNTVIRFSLIRTVTEKRRH